MTYMPAIEDPERPGRLKMMTSSSWIGIDTAKENLIVVDLPATAGTNSSTVNFVNAPTGEFLMTRVEGDLGIGPCEALELILNEFWFTATPSAGIRIAQTDDDALNVATS